MRLIVRLVLGLMLASCLGRFSTLDRLHAQDQPVPLTGEYVANDSLDTEMDSDDSQTRQSLQRLHWPPTSFSVSVEALSGDSGNDSGKADFLVRFPSPKPSGNATVDQVCCEWFRYQGPESARLPAVVVVHESGSGMVVGRMFAQELRRRGVHAFLLQMPGYGQRRVDEPVVADLIGVLMQGVADARRARDAIAVLPGVAADRVALQGTSLGGFVASLAAGLDDGFQCVFLCLSGGDLHGVLTSGQREARKALERLLASGIKHEELKDRLAPIEPLNLARRLDPETTWMYTASFDQVVPPRNSTLLADAIGLSSEHHVRLLATHYSGVIYLPGICEKVVKVLRTDRGDADSTDD